jgi:hypothetical protein
MRTVDPDSDERRCPNSYLDCARASCWCPAASAGAPAADARGNHCYCHRLPVRRATSWSLRAPTIQCELGPAVGSVGGAVGAVVGSGRVDAGGAAGEATGTVVAGRN